MNADILLTHFERVADAPDAVARLRRFILDLAVRGKLVEQDSNEEPAYQLLRQVQQRREELLKTKQIKMSRAEYGPMSAGDDFPLPPGWVRSTISETCELLTGATPDRSRPEFFGGDIPWLVSGDINKGEITECQGRITQLGLDSSNCKILPRNSVLIALNGQGKTRATTAILRMNAACNQSLVAIVSLLPELLTPEFLYLNLRSRYTAIRHITGDGDRRGLNMKLISCFTLSFPPLNEQQRIVSRVSELMSLCDQLEAAQAERESRRDRLAAASLQRLNQPDEDIRTFHEHVQFYLNNLSRLVTRPEQVAALRQTILNLAVQGELTNGNPDDEPAVELFGRIQEDISNLSRIRKADRQPSPSVVANNLSFRVKSGWINLQLSQLLMELQTGPFGSSLHQSDYREGGIPVINPASLKNEQIIPIPGMAVGADTLERLSTFRLRRGDIVLARRGEMGRCALVTEREAGWLCGTGCLILRLPQQLHAPYFVKLLGSPLVRDYLDGSAVGATMQNLNQSILLNLTIGLPPLAEQRRIVTYLDEMMGICDQLEATLSITQSRRQLLLEGVLSEALGIPLLAKNTEMRDIPEPTTNNQALDEIRNTSASRETRFTSDHPVRTAAEMVECVDDLGGTTSPDRLLAFAGLHDDIDTFFNLLREAKRLDLLSVPSGFDGTIKKLEHETR